MSNSSSDDLFPEVRNPEGTCFINGRCLVLSRDNRRVVLVSAIPIAQYAPGDRMSEAHAMISLVEFLVEYTSGTPPLASYGYSVFLPANSGNSYQLVGIYPVGGNSGTYSFAADSTISPAWVLTKRTFLGCNWIRAEVRLRDGVTLHHCRWGCCGASARIISGDGRLRCGSASFSSVRA